MPGVLGVHCRMRYEEYLRKTKEHMKHGKIPTSSMINASHRSIFRGTRIFCSLWEQIPPGKHFEHGVWNVVIWVYGECLSDIITNWNPYRENSFEDTTLRNKICFFIAGRRISLVCPSSGSCWKKNDGWVVVWAIFSTHQFVAPKKQHVIWHYQMNILVQLRQNWFV